MDLLTLLIIGHVVGTILGVGGATIAEVQWLRAKRNGDISADERALMHANYTVIRVGTVIVVLSGILLVLYHLSLGNTWVITSPTLWFKDLLVVFIVFNAIFLTKRMIPFWLGSAAALTSWWMATILGLWRGVPYSFAQLLVAYVILVLLVALILEGIRRWGLSSKKP